MDVSICLANIDTVLLQPNVNTWRQCRRILCWINFDPCWQQPVEEPDAEQTRVVIPMSFYCWASVADAGPTVNRHCDNVFGLPCRFVWQVPCLDSAHRAHDTSKSMSWMHNEPSNSQSQPDYILFCFVGSPVLPGWKHAYSWSFGIHEYSFPY